MTDLSPESALEELKPREPIFHKRSYGTSLEALEAMTDEAFWEVGASSLSDLGLMLRRAPAGPDVNGMILLTL